MDLTLTPDMQHNLLVVFAALVFLRCGVSLVELLRDELAAYHKLRQKRKALSSLLDQHAELMLKTRNRKY